MLFKALKMFQEMILAQFGVDIREWNVDVNTTHVPSKEGVIYNVVVTGDCEFSCVIFIPASSNGAIRIDLSTHHRLPNKPRPQSISETIACATN